MKRSFFHKHHTIIIIMHGKRTNTTHVKLTLSQNTCSIWRSFWKKKQKTKGICDLSVIPWDIYTGPSCAKWADSEWMHLTEIWLMTINLGSPLPPSWTSAYLQTTYLPLGRHHDKRVKLSNGAQSVVTVSGSKSCSAELIWILSTMYLKCCCDDDMHTSQVLDLAMTRFKSTKQNTDNSETESISGLI